MKVVVFGASGRVGSRVVAQLLAAGHEVTAVVHSRNPFTDQPKLRVESLDVHDGAKATEVISGSQAVLSCLSSWQSESKDVLTTAMKSLVPAMHNARVSRIVSLTGNAAFTPDDNPSFIQKANRAAMMKVAPKVLADGEQHMAVLRESGLDWTVLRSPVMNSLGKDAYRLSEKLSGATATINRQAVARALVDQLTDTKWIGKAPTIWRA
ncbi:NAD(P)H-binding protein [Candidatus Saccharibacteria bacterium]|nr:NAD(P)H-binding protein [Candidatus Saccharibacteria bacterium]